MPKVITSLVEQFADLRSNELAFKFVVENQGQNAIEILSVTPRIPEGIRLVEVKDPSMAIPTTRHDELCVDLTQIISMEIFAQSAEARKNYAKTSPRTVGLFDVIIDVLANPLLAVSSLLKVVEAADQRNSSLTLKIENSSEAVSAFNKFLKEKANPVVCDIFQTKIAQLRDIEKLMDRDKNSTIATVESESFFAATYILRFPRSVIDSRKYNIDIEVSYQEGRSKRRHVVNANTSVIISPSPFVLSTIAVVSGLLGVLLRISIDSSVPKENFWNTIYQAFIGAQGITAVILAFIFFNVYEHTEFGSKIRLGVSWRTAVLIGALCGLLSDRILAALQSFIQA